MDLHRTRAQLRHETVPERFERQSQPALLIEGRLRRALRPVRSPIRAVDIATTKQDPFQDPGGYALADAVGEHFDDKHPEEAPKDAPMVGDSPIDDKTP